MTNSENHSFTTSVSSQLYNCSTITFENELYQNMEFSNQDVQVQIMKQTETATGNTVGVAEQGDGIHHIFPVPHVPSSRSSTLQYPQSRVLTSFTQDINTNKNTIQNNTQSIFGLIDKQGKGRQGTLQECTTLQQSPSSRRSLERSRLSQPQQSSIFSQQSMKNNICDSETDDQWNYLGKTQTQITDQYRQLNYILKKKQNQTDSTNTYQIDELEKKNLQISRQQSVATTEQELEHYTQRQKIEIETQYSLPSGKPTAPEIQERKQLIQTQISDATAKRRCNTLGYFQTDLQLQGLPQRNEFTIQSCNEKESNIYDSKSSNLQIDDMEPTFSNSYSQILCESYDEQSNQSNVSNVDEYTETNNDQQDIQQENRQIIYQQYACKPGQNQQFHSTIRNKGAAEGPHETFEECRPSRPSSKSASENTVPTLQQIVEEQSVQLSTQSIKLNAQNVDHATPKTRCATTNLNLAYLDLENTTDSQITNKQENINKLTTFGFKTKPEIMKDLHKNYVQTINKQYDGRNFIVYHASLQNWSIIKKVLKNKIIKKNLSILNSKDKQNKNLLFYAIYYQKNNIVKKLLTFLNTKDQINILTKCNNSPFKCSILTNNLPISQLLYQKGADPNYVSDITGLPLVMELIKYANAEIMKNFINKFQPNFNIPNKQGLLPLQYFCYFRSDLYSDKSPHRFNIQQIQQIDHMYSMFAIQQIKCDFNIQDRK